MNEHQDIGFEFLEHTADVQIHCWGRSLSQLFEQAALGLSCFMYGSPSLAQSSTEKRPFRTFNISLDATDDEALLVDFLSQVLTTALTRGQQIHSLRVEFPRPGSLQSIVETSPSAPLSDIKAVTYHALVIQRSSAHRVEGTITLDL